MYKSLTSTVITSVVATLLSYSLASGQEHILIHGEETRIGAADGAGPEVFGLLHAAAVDLAGRLYILDALDRRLKVFRPSGTFIGSTGGEGRGPGEFLSPVDLAVGSDGTVAVLDPRNGRITLYDLKSGRLELLEEFSIRFPTKGLCFLGNQLWVVGPREEHGMHMIGKNGEIVKSIRRLTAQHPILRRSSAGDIIACDEHTGQIYVASAIHPEVTAYDTTGRRKWSTPLRDFDALEVVEEGGGAITYRAADGRHDMITRLVPINSNVMVQFGELSPDTKTTEDITEVQTRLLDGTTGKEIPTTGGLPRLDAAKGPVGVGLVNLPFPHVRVYSLISRNR